MAIQPISNNSQQNNIYALSSATIIGTAGAFAGYNYAPRAAKNMDEFLGLSADQFSRTLENIERSNPKLLLESMPLISAKLAIETPKERLQYIFPNDKILVTDLATEISKQEAASEKSVKAISNFVKAISKKKGEELSLSDYFKELKDKKVLNEELADSMILDLKEIVGEEGFNAKLVVDDDFIALFKEYENKVKGVSKEDIKFLKDLLKLKKGDYVYKSDALEAVKQQTKPKLKAFVEELKNQVPFDSIKKYIPRVNKAKWAAIIGGSAAAITALGVKIFKENN